MSNYYNILGLTKNASEDEIKQAYRNLAKTHHPDKGGNKEKFQEIQEAYDTLSDPQKKHIYDNPAPSFDDIFGGGFGGFPFNMFQTHQNRKKSDHYYTCNIKLDEVFTGLKKIFILKRNFKCKNCQKICTKCNGSGNNQQRVQIGPIIQILNQPCGSCNSSGKIKDSQNCDICTNKGTIEENKTIEINIPKGVENNHRFTYEEWGEQPDKDNENPGDLIINIVVQKHDHFERRGLDLYYTYDLTIKESIVGKKISIPYFSNSIEVDISEYGIINPAKEYIIFQKGLENVKGQKGSMYIKFNIKYPNKILNTTESQEINNLFTKLNIE